MRRTWWVGGAVVVLTASGILGACGFDDNSSFDKVSGEVSTPDGGASEAGFSGDAVDRVTIDTRESAGPALGEQVAPERDVIYTGDLTVQVDDAPTAADQARIIATDAGGYLARSSANLDGEAEVSVTLRVPSDEFDATLVALADLGTVQGRGVDSNDVTDQVVDLEGRLENARASTDRLRELLVEAQDVQHVIAIEDRLTQREGEIEAISGQLEVLTDQVTLATINVILTEKDAPTVSDDVPGFVESFKVGGVAVANVALVALAAVGFALPFVPIVALAWWLVRRWRRRTPR